MVWVKAPNRLLIEFTSRCNLRCVYCHKSQPDAGNGSDLPDEVLEKAVAYAISHPTSRICVNGNGETTLRKNWDYYCDRILEKNVNLGIITNLSKEFTDKELSTLCRFKSIEVSCDTADPHCSENLDGARNWSDFFKTCRLLNPPHYGKTVRRLYFPGVVY